MPSEWYDNFPNAILESFAYSKAVIATDFGSLPELVKNGQTGLTFKYGDTDDLRRCARQMLSNQDEARRMGKNAFEILQEKYSPSVHYKALMEVVEPIINQKR